MCIDWWNGMRITSRCWRSAIWRFPPRLRNAFTNSRTHCRLEPSWTQKPFEQETDLLYLYWRVRCWRRQCLSPPRSSFFSLHSVLCALGFVHHHFTLLKKKKEKKNCHGSSTSHTETSAHPTLFQTSHLLFSPEQSCLSTLNQTSTCSSVLSESVGWVGFLFVCW